MTPEERYEDLVEEFAGVDGVTPPTGGSGFGRGALRYRRKIFAMFVRGQLVVKLPAPRVDELVTGGHGEDAVDHLYDGDRHIVIPVERHDVAATHGAGCTHSATLAAGLARGLSLEEAAREAASVASEAVRLGLAELGHGDGPVDVSRLKGAA